MIQYFSTILWPVLVCGNVDSQLAFHHKVTNFAYMVSQLYALYMFTSHTQNGQNTHNKSFENVSNLKYFGMIPKIKIVCMMKLKAH